MNELNETFGVRMPISYIKRYHELSRFKKRLFQAEAALILMKLIEKYEQMSEEELLNKLNK